MKVAKTIEEIQEFLKINRQAGEKISFVPTMGALHEGHISLIKEAKKYAKIVVVSIFVNKTQFNDQNDFLNYPKTLQKDLELLQNSKISAVFAPEDLEIFPQNFAFQITPKSLTNCLCGQFRAGHFDGVCLVLTKLFNIVVPDFAFFGEKDFQQLAIIRKLVADLNFNLKIIGCPTIRESNGLAKSSRNQRLSDQGKERAALIFKVLQEVRELVKRFLEKKEVKVGSFESEENYEEIEKKFSKNLSDFLEEKKQELLEIGFAKIDYFELRNEENLELIKDFENFKISENPKIFKKFLDKSCTSNSAFNPSPTKKIRIFLAAHLEQVRLIDNLEV